MRADLTMRTASKERHRVEIDAKVAPISKVSENQTETAVSKFPARSPFILNRFPKEPVYCEKRDEYI